MKGQAINRNLLIFLLVVVGAGVLNYVFFGGLAMLRQGDIPTPPSQATVQPSAPASTTQPAPTSQGAALPSVVGGEATPSTSAPPSAQTGAPESAGKTKAEPAKPLTEEQKLKGLEDFEKIDSREILRKRLDEATESLSKVDPEEGLPYPGVGRVDPLTYVYDAIPEELRPPRSGETNEDEILSLLMAQGSTEIIDSFYLDVYSVMKIGMDTYVSFAVLSPFQARLSWPVGASNTWRTWMSADKYSWLAYITLELTSATQDLVTFAVTVETDKETITRVKHYVPGRPSSGGRSTGVGGGGGGY